MTRSKLRCEELYLAHNSAAIYHLEVKEVTQEAIYTTSTVKSKKERMCLYSIALIRLSPVLYSLAPSVV